MSVPPDFERAEISSRVGFAANLFDRAAELREDEAARAALRAGPEARFAVVAGDRPVLRRAGEGFTIWHEAARVASLGRIEHEVFLGREAGAGRFGLRVSGDLAAQLAAEPNWLVLDLRSLAIQGLVPPAELGAVGETKAMTDWHARHGFCANCGQPTAPASGGWKRECEACKAQHFPRTDPVTIMLIVRGDRCLLARQPRFPPESIPASPASSSPARPSRTRSVARRWRRRGSMSGRCATSPPSPGPFRPR